MATKLYLGKTKEIQKDQLKNLVLQYGMVKSFEDKDSYCFVDYFYESDARVAQVELDGQILNGCKLVAQFSKTSTKVDDISKEALPTQAKRVYVGNLNYKFSYQELQTLFSRFGQINELIHKDTYALVEFVSQQAATQTIIHLNDKQIKGETLKVDMQKCYDEILTIGNRIFIGKINSSIKKVDLIQNFGQFGFIEDITIKEDHYAFIQYKNILQASKAIKEMNGVIIKDCRVLVQEAKSKQNYHQHNQQQNLSINQIPKQQIVAFIPQQVAYPMIINQSSGAPVQFLAPLVPPSALPQQQQQQQQISQQILNQNNLNNMFLPELSIKSRSRSRSQDKKQFKLQ